MGSYLLGSESRDESDRRELHGAGLQKEEEEKKERLQRKVEPGEKLHLHIPLGLAADLYAGCCHRILCYILNIGLAPA